MPNKPDGKVHYRELPNRLGYIGIANEDFANEDGEPAIVEPLREALEALKHTRGLVIDLRGNTGGADVEGD